MRDPIIVKDRSELGQWWSERTPLEKVGVGALTASGAYLPKKAFGES